MNYNKLHQQKHLDGDDDDNGEMRRPKQLGGDEEEDNMNVKARARCNYGEANC